MYSVAYKKAESLKSALETLKQDSSSKLLAGGTDLILKLKHGVMSKRTLIDISEIPELCSVQKSAGSYRIGAAVKLATLLQDADLQQQLPLLIAAVKKIGSMEIRNMGTIGGNLCCARANCGVCYAPGCTMLSGGGRPPCVNAAYSDLLLPLYAYEAKLIVCSADAERTVPLSEFQNEKGALNLKRDEIVREIVIPIPQAEVRFGCAELRFPQSMGRPILSVVAAVKGAQTTVMLGGSLQRVYCLPWPQQLPQINYCDCLSFSIAYRQQVLPQLIDEAVQEARAASDRDQEATCS